MMPELKARRDGRGWTLRCGKAAVAILPLGDDVAEFKLSGSDQPRSWYLLAGRLMHLGQATLEWEGPLMDDSVVMGGYPCVAWSFNERRGAVEVVADDPDTGDEWAARLRIKAKMTSLAVVGTASMCREQMVTIGALIQRAATVCAQAPMGLLGNSDIIAALEVLPGVTR